MAPHDDNRWVVFLGPTLPHAEASRLFSAEYHPPARMGDVYALLSSGLAGIVLIDGVFHGSPAIWQRELLEALDEGIPVIGASSMGALRAAELCSNGMRGVGCVFEWYRDGTIDADDEVALLHGPAETQWTQLSEPLVNLRMTLERASAAGPSAAGAGGGLSSSDAGEVLEVARGLHYAERSRERLISELARRGWAPDRLSRLVSALETHQADIKREDAIYALQLAGELRGRPRDAPPHARAEAPTRWRKDRLLRAVLGERRGNDLLEELGTDQSLKARVAWECYALDLARDEALGPSEADRERARAHLVQVRMSSSKAWRTSGLLPGWAEELAARRVMLDRLADEGEGPLQLLERWCVANGVDHLDVVEGAPPSPGSLGLQWEEDVALLEAWQMDQLFGPPSA